MWFGSLIRVETGCAAYLTGSIDAGECAVFDPLWDIRPSLAAGARQAYETFFEADADIRILVEARAEYARLPPR
jgi:hypothetical protein